MLPAIDLFSGCGGLSTGLLDAGVPVIAGFDHDKPSVVAFNYNHLYRGSTGYVADLNEVDAAWITDVAGVDKFSLVAGGPPCQSFSIAGKRQGLQDSRGSLIFRFAEIAVDLNPQAIMLENVPNLASIEDGQILATLRRQLEDGGYKVQCGILNAADYGVPQARKRLVVLAIKGQRDFPFPPTPSHSADPGLFGDVERWVTVSEAIGALPDVEDPLARNIPNHEPTMHSDRMLEAFRTLTPGTRDKKSFHDRLHAERVGYTLRAGSGNFSPLRPVHYEHDRVISVRESARLQGFSDEFIWPDPLPRLQQYRQVGNAVPPPLARALGELLAGHLGWDVNPEQTKGSPSSRPPAFTTTYEERAAERKRRMRGASV